MKEFKKNQILVVKRNEISTCSKAIILYAGSIVKFIRISDVYFQSNLNKRKARIYKNKKQENNYNYDLADINNLRLPNSKEQNLELHYNNGVLNIAHLK